MMIVWAISELDPFRSFPPVSILVVLYILEKVHSWEVRGTLKNNKYGDHENSVRSFVEIL